MLRIMLAAICLIAFISLNDSAAAKWGGPCPRGSILRVHLGRCVGTSSRLASGYVHKTGGFVHKPRRVVHKIGCDPMTMCGDPIEDRVVDPPRYRDPPQTGGTTPRDEVPDAAVPSLPQDAFIRHGLIRQSPLP